MHYSLKWECSTYRTSEHGTFKLVAHSARPRDALPFAIARAIVVKRSHDMSSLAMSANVAGASRVGIVREREVATRCDERTSRASWSADDDDDGDGRARSRMWIELCASRARRARRDATRREMTRDCGA